MKINSVCITPVLNTVSFKSNLTEPQKVNTLNRDDKTKIITGLAGLAAIGAAAVSTAVLKKQNTTPAQFIKKGFSNLAEKLCLKSAEDPIIKKLNGKRDAQALKLYKGYKAEEKMNSLHNKLLSGYFDGKPQKVFESLRKNERKLRREAAIVM